MTSETIYHYVYRITNLVEKKHYYGKRSSRIEPKLDLGKKYFSSSTDKVFRVDQKSNPQNYKYKIVQVFASATLAIIRESELHRKFNVGTNPVFYNKVKQTPNGFDSTGFIFSDKIKEKISRSNTGKTASKEAREKMSKSALGRSKSEETKAKISKTTLGVPKSKKHRENISKGKMGNLGRTGMTNSPLTRQRISEGKLGKCQPKHECPYCGLVGGNAMLRWHFENCKTFKSTDYV